MIVLRPEEMREMDKYTIEDAIPDILLMEAAGRGVAEKAHAFILEKSKCSSEDKRKNILVIAGKGNNGGDGYVAARILNIMAYNVRVISLAEEEELQGNPFINYRVCKARGISINNVNDLGHEDINLFINQSGLVIDAMLGTGLKGDVRGIISEIIDLLNNSNTPVLSVDIPSGLDGETGNIHGKAVKAVITATMAFHKLGLCLYPGRELSGKVEPIDLGMPEISINRVKYNHFMLNEREAASLLPVRRITAHKGSFGKITVIGGSMGMTGAPFLTGMASLKMGAGLVTIAVPSSIQDVVASYMPELITQGLKENEGLINKDAIEKIEELTLNSDLLLIGPGMGKSADLEFIIKKIITEFNLPIVLDADGMNAISDLNLLKHRKGALIMTPHPGEMARLLNLDISQIEENRVETARKFAVEYNVNLILKGASTIIALPDTRVYINPTANEGMATAGSGDVLTGIIGALLAQGLDAERASILGPYIHGLAGDLAKEELSSYSLSAGNIIDYIPAAIKKLIKY
jgi:ADP-dependent NAD(P)H-hydrate dehydratase / NAD(P)H-hydrate epimerase